MEKDKNPEVTASREDKNEKEKEIKNTGGEVKTTVKRPKKEDSRINWKYGSIILVLIAAFLVSLFFYKQKIEVEVLKNLTEGWQTFESEKYGFSFKCPKDWEITDLTDQNAPKEDPTVMYTIQTKKGEEANDFSLIAVRVNNERGIGHEEPENAIQVSVPFDKRNYLIFSTATNNDKKIEFYNMLATLETGKK